MQQTWLDLLFAHWPVSESMLRPHIPPGVALDTYDDSAWLSIVPFRMQGVRPRGAPGLPWLSAFAELNVRTYVHLPSAQDPMAKGLIAGDPVSDLGETSAQLQDATKPGVFFFSLDAANPLAVEIARAIFHLPYFNAQMQCKETGGQIHYRSVRTDKRAAPGAFQAVYGPTGGVQPAAPGSLEHWLAERYALYTTDAQGRLYCGEIHHAPWPLQTAEVEVQVNTLAESVGLSLPTRAPLVQFAHRLDVLIWPLRPVTAVAAQRARPGG